MTDYQIKLLKKNVFIVNIFILLFSVVFIDYCHIANSFAEPFKHFYATNMIFYSLTKVKKKIIILLFFEFFFEKYLTFYLELSNVFAHFVYGKIKYH